MTGADQAAIMLGNADGEISGLTITISDPPTQAEVQALREVRKLGELKGCIL